MKRLENIEDGHHYLALGRGGIVWRFVRPDENSSRSFVARLDEDYAVVEEGWCSTDCLEVRPWSVAASEFETLSQRMVDLFFAPGMGPHGGDSSKLRKI